MTCEQVRRGHLPAQVDQVVERDRAPGVRLGEFSGDGLVDHRDEAGE